MACFSEGQLAKMAGKKRISQARWGRSCASAGLEGPCSSARRLQAMQATAAACLALPQDTFDAAVRENIEEFEMEASETTRAIGTEEPAAAPPPAQPGSWPLPSRPLPTRSLPSLQPEEAVASAVQEFEAQGVDLSNIIKTASGGDIGRCARVGWRGRQRAQGRLCRAAGHCPLAAASQHIDTLPCYHCCAVRDRPQPASPRHCALSGGAATPPRWQSSHWRQRRPRARASLGRRWLAWAWLRWGSCWRRRGPRSRAPCWQVGTAGGGAGGWWACGACMCLGDAQACLCERRSPDCSA